MITPRQLVDEMSRRGRSVSERQLRDWRGRRLLPALTSRGKGQGLGRHSFWEDQGILNRAIAVYELFPRRERFPDAHYLEMWFAGYPADYDVVRKAWLSLLSYTERALLRSASDPDGIQDANPDVIEDALAPISAQIGRKMSSDTGLPYEETQALALEILNTILSPADGFDIAECTELIDTANTWLSRASAPHVDTGEMLQKALAFVHANFSLKSMHRVISAATDAELDDAHRRWRVLRHVIALLAPTSCDGEISAELSRTGIRLSVTLGCPGIFALLYLGRIGKGPLVDSRLNEAEHEIRTAVCSM